MSSLWKENWFPILQKKYFEQKKNKIKGALGVLKPFTFLVHVTIQVHVLTKKWKVVFFSKERYIKYLNENIT